MISALYHHFRNNHPIIYAATFIAALTIVVLQFLSFAAANTALFDTLGANALKTRIVAAKEYSFWRVRAWRNNSVAGAIEPEHRYGFLQSVNKDGTLNVTIIKDNKYQPMRITLADIHIINTDALAAIVELHKSDNADFDLYQTGQTYPYTVVWLNNEPLNIQIIAAGIASPDMTPPTNIIDRLFAEYYYKQLTR
jgi:hypothetical protein